MKVGVGAFAQCQQIKDAITKFPSHAVENVYTWMGDQEGIDMVPSTDDKFFNFVIHESVARIKNGTFSFYTCYNISRIIIRSNYVQIDEGAFAAKNPSCTIEWPPVMQSILNGTYARKWKRQTLSSMLQNCTSTVTIEIPQSLFPTIHENAFGTGCEGICKILTRYKVLQTAWEWVFQKENVQQHHQSNVNHKTVDIVDTGEPNSPQPSLYATAINHPQLQFTEKEVLLLHQTFSLQPPPPNDIIDAILDYLQNTTDSNGTFLRAFPRDVILNILTLI